MNPRGFIKVSQPVRLALIDRVRYLKDQQEILFAKFTEADIHAGRLVNSESKLKQVINRLSDYGGGVHYDRENHQLRLEQEERKTPIP